MEYGIDQAEIEIENQLLRFVDFVGAKDKYNKTVTIAAMKAVHHFMQKSESENFKDLITENQQFSHNFKALIAKHYSIDIFNTDLAKSTYLAPDLLPFD
jgi:uncharacterized protein (DUF4213/DUF364 family)